MENYERDPVDFFRSDPCPAAFAAAVPKNHLPPGAVRPVGAGGAAAAGAGQPARHGAQRPDGGGAGDGPDHRPGPVCDPLPGDHCLRPAGCLPDPRPLSALPGGHRHGGQHRDIYRRKKRHPFHRVSKPDPPDPCSESRLVRRDVCHGGVVPACEPPLHASSPPEPETLPGGKLPLSGVSDGGAALPLSVRPVSPRCLPDPRRRGIPGDPAACSDPRDHPRPPSGPPVEPAAVRVSGGVLVRPAGMDRRHRLPPGLRAGL